MPRTTRRYSFLSVLREARRQHSGWGPAWRKAHLKKAYDVVIVGAGGHGLATAYYLAKLHGIHNVAVLEKGWLGGGNTARNTTIVRSNYLHPASMALYGLSHSLFEHLTPELNFNVMFSPRGLVELAFTQRDLNMLARTADANSQFGLKTWMIPPDEARSLVPLLDPSAPLYGALFQPRGGVARHDAVAWAYARKASELGVDIIENCSVESLVVKGSRVSGLETSQGHVSARTVVVAAAADSAALVAPAGVQLPIEPFTLQALVSEPLKPVLDVVVLAGTELGYVSQSDKGELVIGGATDLYPSYSRRGSFPALQETVASMIHMFPALSRLRMMRHWGGTVDLTPDRSPLIGPAGPDGLFINCGWGTGGFKAIPGSGFVAAASLAAGAPHAIARPFGLDRFATGRLIDESAASAVAH
jgi:sarcosine oxidase subunit beta